MLLDQKLIKQNKTEIPLKKKVVCKFVKLFNSVWKFNHIILNSIEICNVLKFVMKNCILKHSVYFDSNKHYLCFCFLNI